MMEAKKGVLKHEEMSSEDAKEAGFATVEESAVGKETINRSKKTLIQLIIILTSSSLLALLLRHFFSRKFD